MEADGARSLAGCAWAYSPGSRPGLEQVRRWLARPCGKAAPAPQKGQRSARMGGQASSVGGQSLAWRASATRQCRRGWCLEVPDMRPSSEQAARPWQH
eukprot:74165-Alexandrium_andersonii.AAC.1